MQHNDRSVNYHAPPPPTYAPTINNNDKYMQPMGAPQQQQQQQNTTVVINQPQAQQGAKLKLVDIHGIRDWSTGLCDCFSDITGCLFTLFCYPCAMCQMATRTGECCCTSECVPGFGTVVRSRIRTIGGIRGNVCSDYVTVCLLPYCAACQEDRELKRMGL